MAIGPEVDPRPSANQTLFAALLDKALTRARLALFWERLWPSLAAIGCILGLFLALSWLGLWLSLPSLWRAVGLVLFGLALLATAFPLVFARFPSRHEGLQRLDRHSGLAHRPATAITDRLAVSSDDPVSRALWQEHLERAIQNARRLKAGLPVPRLSWRDPYAVRALVVMLVVATFIAAGGERTRRITAAFDWRGVIAAPNFRVDAWVTPPTYTGRPPIILPGLRPGETARATAPVAVPVGSTLVIRASGTDELDVAVKGGLKPDTAAEQAQAPGAREQRFIVQEQGEATLRGVGSGDVRWSFSVIPDSAPTIALTKDPEPQLRGSLQLHYKMEDDYGVTEAHARFALKPEKRGPLSPRSETAPRALYGAPDFPLVLPQARARTGAAQTLKDLYEHPWAGAEVAMTLAARDEADNEGVSEPKDMRLPQRPFVKPLARALVEQRRILALDAEAKPRVLTALDALTLAPEKFTPESSIYLGLRSLYWNLANARNDDALRDVVVRLWQMAVQIEDGNVSAEEAALRAAQEALRQALERGASDEEIKRLTDDLRAALDRFMQALAEEMRKNPERLARQMPNTRNLSPLDLKNMIDRMENLARSGAKDAARRMLEELQSILENLQMARPGQPQDGEQDDMMSALNELGEMIQRQQQLRDRTFREGQEQRRERQRGQRQQPGQRQGSPNADELRQNQQALRDQLKRILEEMRKRGMGQNQGEQGEQGEQGQGQNGMDQLGRAEDSMGDAEGQLGEGNAEGAVDSQGRALEALRRGAQNLAQSLQQQMGEGEGPGDPSGRPQNRAGNDTDPLGRPRNDRNWGYADNPVEIPGVIDAQRARRVLEELRRRLSDPLRPQIELDYLERLLKDF